MKTCSKCKEEKELAQFHKNKTRLDGFASECKLCVCIRCKEYHIKNRDQNLLKSKEYNKKNKDSLYKKKREDFINNPEKHRIWHRNFKNNNPEAVIRYRKNNYEKNKEKILAANKEWAKKNKEKIKEYKKKWADAHQLNYIKERFKNDNIFSLKKRVSSLILVSIKGKGYTKRSRTHEILGCSYEDFKIHIERQFTKGMTWDNRDKWHIDHIIPMATAKTEEDVIRLNHYTNLRPLWAEENLSKSDKIITHQLVLL